MNLLDRFQIALVLLDRIRTHALSSVHHFSVGAMAIPGVQTKRKMSRRGEGGRVSRHGLSLQESRRRAQQRLRAAVRLLATQRAEVSFIHLVFMSRSCSSRDRVGPIGAPWQDVLEEAEEDFRL